MGVVCTAWAQNSIAQSHIVRHGEATVSDFSALHSGTGTHTMGGDGCAMGLGLVKFISSHTGDSTKIFLENYFLCGIINCLLGRSRR